MNMVAMIDCIHANTGSEICAEWFKSHTYCNGCPNQTPNPKIKAEHLEKSRGHMELALDVALVTPSGPDLVKKFKATHEQLQHRDSTMMIRQEIVDYLVQHGDKINRIEVECDIDEATMAPTICLRMWFITDHATTRNEGILKSIMK